MVLNHDQWEKIWLISDTLLYPEAVKLVCDLIEDQKYAPLPATQANGLLSIAGSSHYTWLMKFVKHQRGRKWSPNKENVPKFYEALEKFLTDMYRKRLSTEFSLVSETAGSQERDEVMIVLARECIQHLVAENGLFEARAKDERARQKNGKGSNDA